MKNCPKSKCLFSVVILFIALFGYDYLVHGVLLADAYKATAALWRPEAEMQKFFPLCIAYHLAITILISALYCQICKSGTSCDAEQKACCPVKKGMCFGVTIGLFLGVLNASAYIHLPMPASLAISWFFAGLGQGIFAGAVLGTLSKIKSCGKK